MEKKDGCYECFYDNGVLKERTTYRGDKKNGVSEKFSTEGLLIERKWFGDGNEVGEKEFLLQREKSKDKYRIEMRSKIIEYREATRALLLELQTSTSERKEQAQKLMALRKKYGHNAKEHIKEFFWFRVCKKK